MEIPCKMDRADLAEQEELLALYMAALGGEATEIADEKLNA